MDAVEQNSPLGLSSEDEDSELSDGELQEAFVKGLLKPGLNVAQQEAKKTVNNVEGLKQCLVEFQKNLPWAERLDLVNLPAADIVAKAEGKETPQDGQAVSADDDFRGRYFCGYRQAQEAVLEALPRLQKLKIATKRPEDYFAEMAKTDQHMQKIRKKLILKQTAMERSEKAKRLREQRKYGKKVQTEVLQKRQKEKKAMMSAVKKYQKGMTDKLDFLDGDLGKEKKGAGITKKATNKGPNAKRKFKDQKFGFGGKKRGSKWNTKDSHNDVSGFKAKLAHGKEGKKLRKGGKQKPKKRPGKETRRKMKSR